MVRIAEVYLPIPIAEPFSYLVPDFLIPKVKKGIRVIVSIKNRKVMGFVKEIRDIVEDDLPEVNKEKLKPIEAIFDPLEVYREEADPLVEFIAHRTFSSPGEVLKAVAPSSLRRPKRGNDYSRSWGGPGTAGFKRVNFSRGIKIPSFFMDKVVSSFRKNAYFGFYTGTFLKRLQFFWEIYRKFWEIMKIPPRFMLLLPTETHLENFFVPAWLPEDLDIITFSKKMKPSQAYMVLEKALSGNFDGVVGLRRTSIIPYPENSLDLIFVMEEGDESYRSPKVPKYDAVITALFQGKLHNCPVFLLDSVPSVRSYYMMKKGEFSSVVVAKSRKAEYEKKILVLEVAKSIPLGKGYLHPHTFSAIKKTLEKRRSVLIVVPRKGYSFLKCKTCGYIPKCPRCGVPLRYHADEEVLRCHYCGYQTTEMLCPNCRQGFFEFISAGDEHVESFLSRLLGGRFVGVHDEENPVNPEKVPPVLVSTVKVLNTLANHEFASKFGLAVILFGDVFLSFSDYAVDERFYRLFSILLRDLPLSEKLIIEVRDKFNFDSSFPRPESIKDTLEKLLSERHKEDPSGSAAFPPYAQIVLLKVKERDPEKLERKVEKIKAELSRSKSVMYIMDYSPMVGKLRNTYRKYVLLRIENPRDIYRHILELRNGNVSVELNPRYIYTS